MTLSSILNLISANKELTVLPAFLFILGGANMLSLVGRCELVYLEQVVEDVAGARDCAGLYWKTWTYVQSWT